MDSAGLVSDSRVDWLYVLTEAHSRFEVTRCSFRPMPLHVPQEEHGLYVIAREAVEQVVVVPVAHVLH